MDPKAETNSERVLPERITTAVTSPAEGVATHLKEAVLNQLSHQGVADAFNQSHGSDSSGTSTHSATPKMMDLTPLAARLPEDLKTKPNKE